MRHGKYRFIVGFLVPPLLLYGIFVLSPYAQTFYIALTDWRGLSAELNFIGLENFAELVRDGAFWNALRHNGLLLVIVPAVTIALALFFASMLNLGGRRGGSAVQGVRGAEFYKVVYFFPQVLSIAVIAILWQFVYNPRSGLLNGVLDVLGLGFLRATWLGDPSLALWAVMAVLVWSGVGFYVVLFNAAIQAIPRDLFEAALLDGAGRLATFRRVTLPLLWDSVQVAFVYLGIIALDAFALVQIMTFGPGGPDDSTMVTGLYLYKNAFEYARFGYATAIGVAMFFLTLSLAVLTLRVTRRERVEY
ncbi:MAG: ABC transporter permease subunit [Streptosporangiales bacterium]|nr:ABC transporter permease subunit [Streptosporangiales bacterium]